MPKEQLENDTEALLTTARKHLCQFATLRFQQVDGLNTVMPFGTRKIDAFRTLTTESLSVFIPFRVQDIFHENGIYYGQNVISKNMIIADRKQLLNGMPDDFDIENYTKEVFFMFSGEKVLVDLRCDNSLMKTMVDRFGEDVTTLAYDMTSFRVQTEVSVSPTFFGWVFGFNGKVQILAPESVKEQYRQMIAQADEGMQQKENKEQEI